MTALAPSEAREVPLRIVERELLSLLKAQRAVNQCPVQCARMSNLVIYCHNLATAAEVEGYLPSILQAHPARVLLLVPEDGSETLGVRAWVKIPYSSLMGGVQSCTEQVTLCVSREGLLHLSFAVRALLIGDLPTNLCWFSPQPPPLAGPLLFELADQAQQIVYDSLGWPEPARGVAATEAWLEQINRRSGVRWQVASDLNWRRLKYWRRLIAQALEPASAPGVVESISEVRLEHGPHAVIQAWELASWFAQRLGWQVLTGKVQPGVEIGWRFHSAAGDVRVRIARLADGPPNLRRVRITSTLNGRPVVLDLSSEEAGRLVVCLEGVEGAPRTVLVPPMSPAELISRQLSDREPDRVFLESMGVAQVLARSVLRG